MSKVMTPEEKAKELVEKFKPLAWGNTMFTRNRRIIECANICVDEILNVLTKDNPDYEKTTYWHPADYWKKVKEHLK